MCSGRIRVPNPDKADCRTVEHARNADRLRSLLQSEKTKKNEDNLRIYLMLPPLLLSLVDLLFFITVLSVFLSCAPRFEVRRDRLLQLHLGAFWSLYETQRIDLNGSVVRSQCDKIKMKPLYPMHRIFQTFIDLLSTAEDPFDFSDAMAVTATALELSCFAYKAGFGLRRRR